MKSYIQILIGIFVFSGCQSETTEKSHSPKKELKTSPTTKPSKVEIYYSKNKGNDSASISNGTYGNGTLINGKLIPFKGKNFEYFSETSYLLGRAFLNDVVLKILLESYQVLDSIYPEKKFFIMESSYKKGGEFYPHHTHQNGLSVDLMTPMLKNGKDYVGLDLMGIPHYWITFDEHGNYSKDVSVSIHFNLVAHHILILHEIAQKYGYKVNRVHFQNTLHDELYRTEKGKELRAKGIVLTTLTKVISEQHDDHYHVDFSKI